MSAELSVGALQSLRRSLEADVSAAVQDEVLRAQLLHIIHTRFQHVDSMAVQHSAERPGDVQADEASGSDRQPQPQPQPPTASAAQTAEPAVASAAASGAKNKSRKKRSSALQAASSRPVEQTDAGGGGSSSKPSEQPPPPPPPPPPPSHLPAFTASPSAARDVDLLSSTGAAVALDHTERSGRLLRATAALPAGARLLDDRGYACVVKLQQCREVCALCHSLLDEASTQAALSCVSCRVAHYCSSRCQRIDASYRHPTECRMLGAVRQLSGSLSVDADLLQMLAAVCARRYRERHREQFPCASSAQQQASGDGAVVDEQAEAARWRDDELTLSHVLDLVYHDSLFTPAWLHSVLSACRALAALSPEPALMDCDALLSVAKRINCNSHAILCPSPSAVVGLGLYCRVSLLNHSCQPNCHYQATRYGRMAVHANRAVRPGEELTVHYCDLYDSREERQRQLLKEKGFVCACERCCADMAASVDRLVAGVYCTCERFKQQRRLKADSGAAVQSDEVSSGKWSREDVTVEMAVPAGAALIVWRGDVTRTADEHRKDYRCLACDKKYSQAAVLALLQPLLALHQAATQHRAAGKGLLALSTLEQLLALNRQQLVCTPQHTLLLSSYVLLCNIARHAAHVTASIRYARLVCACYELVFPRCFMETADWRYLETLQLDRLADEWRAKPRQDSKPVRSMLRRLAEERKRAHSEYSDILRVCTGQQASDKKGETV